MRVPQGLITLYLLHSVLVNACRSLRAFTHLKSDLKIMTKIFARKVIIAQLDPLLALHRSVHLVLIEIFQVLEKYRIVVNVQLVTTVRRRQWSHSFVL
jgi:hypothetical protein